MKLIESKTLGTAAASIEFTSIPQSFTDLVLLVSGRGNSGSGSTQLQIQFNGTGSSQYSDRTLGGSGSAAYTSSRTSQNVIFTTVIPLASYTANTFSNASIYIPNYTAAVNKSVSTDGVLENNATAANLEIVAGLWANTAAITTINLQAGGTQFDTGSMVSLYGILKGSDGIVTTS
jgi:hypothetical protein